MSYLSELEYRSMIGVVIDTKGFYEAVKKAEAVLDNVTNNFYQFVDLETDIPFRKNKFKQAVAAQIEYFIEAGGTSSFALNSVKSFSVGRTSISGGGVEQHKAALIADDVYIFLEGTGLLYGGLS